SKSGALPKGFIPELERRITRVLYGKEARREYQDASVKRTFASFYNALTEASFRKQMEKNRRAEELVLIFFSTATKELAKGQPPDDTAWKLLVDRHVALFVRLVSLTIADHDWVRDAGRAELLARLATLEKKLLRHEGDLADRSARRSSQVGPDGGGEALTPGTPAGETDPAHHDVAGMAMVQTVAKVFGLRNSVVQSDINKYRDAWTTHEAMRDLKKYQTHLALAGTVTGGASSSSPSPKYTPQPSDFDSPDAFEAWRKSENNALSQMMLALVHADPALAGQSTTADLSPSSPAPAHAASDDAASAATTPLEENLSSLSLTHHIYTFIPPDPREFFRAMAAEVATFEHRQRASDPDRADTPVSASNLLSKQTAELLAELAARWRVPPSSRAPLFLDVFRDKFAAQEIELPVLDAAFEFVTDVPAAAAGEAATNAAAAGKRNAVITVGFREGRDRWLVADRLLVTQMLSTLHECLLRQLYEYTRLFEQPDHLLPNAWIVVRIDGIGFHKFSKYYGFHKPNDARALSVMNDAAVAVMRRYPDLVLAYGQSDEYSFVFHKSCQLWERRASKLVTAIVSTFTGSYWRHWSRHFPDQPLAQEMEPAFDGRAVLYPSDTNLRDYLCWRQADCHINNLYNTTFWSLVLQGGMENQEAEVALKGTLAADKNEILFSRFGINYNNEPEMYRKGSVVYREY
ncbi:hypothetical protein KEM52_001613, partial [Ascosphaera acerosa]